MSDLFKRAKAGEELEVFLCQDVEHGYYHITYISDPLGSMTLAKGKVRFDFISDDKAIQQGLEVLDKQIQGVRAKAHLEVSRLEERKADLLALTHQGES